MNLQEVKENLVKVQNTIEQTTAAQVPLIERGLGFIVGKFMDLVLNLLVPSVVSRSRIVRIISRELLKRIGRLLATVNTNSN